ncbi:hypothetical protein V1277_000907 [Bradyrhizobium sp. AZCC 1588]|uniref:hypothetical protein n=1 Tax=unclassified Bradyrhizobium TaxID=2631580 RepID=UPI002FEE6C0E
MKLLSARYALMNALPKMRLDRLGFAAIAAFLCFAHESVAQAGSNSCIERVSAYVAELDQLLSKERNWRTPYKDLEVRYAPFLGCEVDALLEEVVKSRFVEPIGYSPRSKTFFIDFTNDDVQVGFVYETKERRSSYHYAIFVRK